MRLNAKFLSALPFLFLHFTSSAQQAYQAKLVTESLLLDVAVHQQTIYAIGERGHVISSDNGQQWQQHQVPTLATLTAIDFAGDSAWAVGHDATIMHRASKDGDWTIQKFEPELQRPLLDVKFFDTRHGIAVGAYGTFFRTRDGGANWTKEMHPEFLHPDDQAYLEEIREEDEDFYQEELASILPHLNRVSMHGDRLYLAGETGLLAYSDNLGERWQRMEVDYMGSFFDIAKTASGRLFAAGLRGNLFEFDEATQEWTAIDTASQSSLNSIVSVGADASLIVGNNGALVCVNQSSVSVTQTDQNDAVVNGVVMGDQFVGVTAGGIKRLSVEEIFNACEKEQQ